MEAGVGIPSDFDALMERIDERLKAKGMPIHTRAFLAQYEAETELGRWSGYTEGLPIPPDDRVKERAARWYDERYGDRVKVDFSPGNAALLLRGDPWTIKLPLIFGRFVFFCGRTEEECALPAGADRPHLNVLDSIGDGGLPTGLRRTLTDAECMEICSVFRMVFDAYRDLGALQKLPMIAAALGNHRASVEYLTHQHADPAAAAWNALEAVEKVLKTYIECAKKPFSRTHDLSVLAAQAEAAGLTPLARRLLDRIQCTPAVRYREIEVSLIKAVDAHHASLEASQVVAVALAASGIVPP